MSSLSLYAAPLLLKCSTSTNDKVTLNIQYLVGEGCHFDTINVNSKKRYNLELCDGIHLNGIIEVLDLQGNWVATEELSTNTNCYTWKNISTSYNCRRRGRYRHTHNCN